MDRPELPTFLKALDPDQQREFLDFLGRFITSTIEGDAALNKVRSDSIREEAVSFGLEKLMEKTGRDPKDLLLHALTLYEVAIDAAAKGQRLVLLSPDYGFIREIVGIGLERPDQPTRHSVAG